MSTETTRVEFRDDGGRVIREVNLPTAAIPAKGDNVWLVRPGRKRMTDEHTVIERRWLYSADGEPCCWVYLSEFPGR